jgi:hypothetical protein
VVNFKSISSQNTFIPVSFGLNPFQISRGLFSFY